MILRQRRLALGLTQEQLAQRLGVSAPAVNKWERNNSYPDITMLPPLARLLEVDLNTLLSFQEELTEEEIDPMLMRSMAFSTAPCATVRLISPLMLWTVSGAEPVICTVGR